MGRIVTYKTKCPQNKPKPATVCRPQCTPNISRNGQPVVGQRAIHSISNGQRGELTLFKKIYQTPYFSWLKVALWPVLAIIDIAVYNIVTFKIM
jgi:hypothetical protein